MRSAEGGARIDPSIGAPPSVPNSGVPKRPPTLREVAAVAGVSAQTASNAFTNPERLTEATLASVRAAVRELGFTPNVAARALRGRCTAFIGLGVEDLTDSDMRSFAVAMDDSACHEGYRLQIVDRIGLRTNLESLIALATRGASAIVLVRRGPDPALRWTSAPPSLEVRLPAPSCPDITGSSGTEFAGHAGRVLWTALRSGVVGRRRQGSSSGGGGS